MTELFEEDLIDEETVVENDDVVELTTVTPDSETVILDARRRLENLLEERRLREELDDFMD